MDATANGHPKTPPAEDPSTEQLPAGWRWTIPRALGVLAFLAMLLFWIWAFANQGIVDHPDEFDDPVFVEAAETLCAARQQAILDLGNPSAVNSPEERAPLVAAGTAELERMVAELGRLTPPTDPKGADGVERWLSDYQLYLGDRRTYTEILASGEDPPIRISGTADGVRVTDLLRTFAEVNDMASCAPSGDV
jgi:hypothetical protein